MSILLSILGLGLLMAVHEAGHFAVARLFGMRVLRFSIGFGPVLFSKKPENSDTTYQIGLFPFLAYVQIAGMNPHEEIEPDDKGSYANASWLGRFLTILAGPLANYLFAVIAFFALATTLGIADGKIDGRRVGAVSPNMPAAAAQLAVGDEIVRVAGKDVKDWQEMRTAISENAGKTVEVVVERNGQRIPVMLTPTAEGRIGIIAKESRRPVGVGEAAKLALVEPPKSAARMVVGLARVITRKDKADLKGPVGIVDEAREQYKQGAYEFIGLFILLSIYLCVFNLIPFPALDGGRIAFLIYEFVSRRRPDAKIEARVHLVGMLTLLTLFLPLFFIEIGKKIIGLFVKG